MTANATAAPTYAPPINDATEVHAQVKQVPHITYINAPDDDSDGYRVGVAMDELVAWAMDKGASSDDLHERLDEAVERAHEEGR